MIYNISDEPNYGFKRKVHVDSINISIGDLFNKAVVLSLIVKYYSPDGSTIIDFIPPKKVPLIADTTTQVDQNGTIVPAGDPTAVMTEYEFFMMMMTIPIVIADMVSQKIAWADSPAGGNRFD
jgi:hypothetical protein